MELNDDIGCVKSIGEQRAKLLKKLNVKSVRDLISYFPRTYEDRSKITAIAEALPGQTVCVRALVVSEPSLSRVRRGLEIVKLQAADDTATLNITFFNQSYVRQQLKQGKSYFFSGRITIDGFRPSMLNPIFEAEESPPTITRRIIPVYRLTAGISQKVLITVIRRCLDEVNSKLPNALPDYVAEKEHLCVPAYAYENIHFPADTDALELARHRLIFEELFVLSLALTQLKESRIKKSSVIISKPNFDIFYQSLPFVATSAQKRAIEEAAGDMASGTTMNRLVQGDVGSGKTLVATACVWCAHEGGLQSAFMAPTEILVNQHYRTLSTLLEPLGVRVAKLSGSMTAKQKREVVNSLQNGEISLAVGTHSLISENVGFKNLSLVITDEQHRFGVNQRAALSEKGKSPHTLVMSATPIPRTLALMIYGDLDISVIDELPPGRQNVDTYVVGDEMRERINRFILKQVNEGRQVFIVCPAIEESSETTINLHTAKEYSSELKERVFPMLNVECIHGKLKPAVKEKTMLSFLNGDIDILVSTTVVEVGVDVPNASLMIVENAERFGLSQLHQLRGRVGRGRHKSYCILFSDADNEEALARLKVMQETNDGFKISEVDLQLRGPGDFFGSRQHGLPEMHIADLCTDVRVLKQAQNAAQCVLAADPGLSEPGNKVLKKSIEELFALSDSKLN